MPFWSLHRPAEHRSRPKVFALRGRRDPPQPEGPVRSGVESQCFDRPVSLLKRREGDASRLNKEASSTRLLSNLQRHPALSSILGRTALWSPHKRLAYFRWRSKQNHLRSERSRG